MIQQVLLKKFSGMVAEIERSSTLSSHLLPFDRRLLAHDNLGDTASAFGESPAWYKRIQWDGRELDKDISDRIIRDMPRVLTVRLRACGTSPSEDHAANGRWLLYDPAFTCYEQFGVETGLLDEADCPGWLFWCAVYPSEVDMWDGNDTARGIKLLSYIPAEALSTISEDLPTYSVCGALRWIEDIHDRARMELLAATSAEAQ